MKKLAPALALVLGLAAVACGEDPKPPPKVATPPVDTTPPPPPPAASAPASSDKMAVNVDSDIVKACNLKFENIEDAPKFDYDSEALTAGEKTVLEAIAKCLTTGPLKGRTVDLVGRADPRGETEYNMTLGAKRARSVHTFLGQLGVPGDKLRDTSRGELDATGTDEVGWRKDRRVDVRLAK
ncbi:MAG: OmpA family protein [Deltaproteobacteria bacterium]|nr:OmpA family protein [Deltaproteobacteria bacterium]